MNLNLNAIQFIEFEFQTNFSYLFIHSITFIVKLQCRLKSATSCPNNLLSFVSFSIEISIVTSQSKNETDSFGKKKNEKTLPLFQQNLLNLARKHSQLQNNFNSTTTDRRHKFLNIYVTANKTSQQFPVIYFITSVHLFGALLLPPYHLRIDQL